MTTADAREERLPRWAQREIAALRRRVLDLEGVLTEKVDAHGPAAAWLDPYRLRSVSGIPVGQPHEPLRFVRRGLGPDAWPYIDVLVTEGPSLVLSIQASGPLAVQPRASNHIRCEVPS